MKTTSDAANSKGEAMHELADFLFQAHFLKTLQRSGYAYLGQGRESVAEHSYLVAMIGLLMSQMTPQADALKLICMCLLHDFTEARIGDLNSVQKRYVKADEAAAAADSFAGLPFASLASRVHAEFNAQRTAEAQLAHDADQLAFLIDLKVRAERGYSPASKWLMHLRARLKTPAGKQLAETVCQTEHDAWWFADFSKR